MSNLKLVPDDPTPMEKMLLDASRAEQPSDEHKQRMMALLGIGLPLSGPLAAPPPAAPAQAAAGMAPQAAAAAARAGKWATLGKVAVGVGVLAVIGAVVLTRESAPAPAPVAQVKPAVADVTPPVAAPAVEAAPAVSPLPPIEEPSAATPSPRSARTDASASADADLGEQIRLIEAARAGVAARDSKAALAALNSYAAKFPRGSFGQEATVLRIRAIDQSGDSARATAMAKSFVARFPNSPHVARLKPIAERGASR